MEEIRIWDPDRGEPKPCVVPPLRGNRNPEPGFTSASPARRTSAPRRAPIPPRHAPFYRTGFRTCSGGCRRVTRPTRATDGNRSASVASDAHSHVLAGETRAKGRPILGPPCARRVASLAAPPSRRAAGTRVRRVALPCGIRPSARRCVVLAIPSIHAQTISRGPMSPPPAISARLRGVSR